MRVVMFGGSGMVGPGALRAWFAGTVNRGVGPVRGARIEDRTENPR